MWYIGQKSGRKTDKKKKKGHQADFWPKIFSLLADLKIAQICPKSDKLMYACDNV